MKGQTLFEGERQVDPDKLDELATALASPTARETATLVPFFGPTILGEQLFIERLGINLSQALLAGMTYSFARPFRPGERVRIRVSVDDFYEKKGMQFAVVLSEATDPTGGLIQRHTATFIERAA